MMRAVLSVENLQLGRCSPPSFCVALEQNSRTSRIEFGSASIRARYLLQRPFAQILRLIKKALQANTNLNTIANLDEAWSGFCRQSS